MPLPLIDKEALRVAWADDVSAAWRSPAFGFAAAWRGADLPMEAR